MWNYHHYYCHCYIFIDETFAFCEWKITRNWCESSRDGSAAEGSDGFVLWQEIRVIFSVRVPMSDGSACGWKPDWVHGHQIQVFISVQRPTSEGRWVRPCWLIISLPRPLKQFVVRHITVINLLLLFFCFFCSVWWRHVANIPVPHHWRQPPADPGADGRERALPAYPPPVCQTAAGGRRRQVTSGNCQSV